MENKEIENIVKMNDKGVYVTPPQDIYIDEEGNTKEVVFEVTRMKNQQLYNQALVKYVADNDVYAFARVIFPKVINKPFEARKVDFFLSLLLKRTMSSCRRICTTSGASPVVH